MRYAAIGDSFTEGVGDELADGSTRGWADLVAVGLAEALAPTGETVSYANLAVRGRLMAPIVGPQLDSALALSPAPTLMSLNGGGNDMMRPSADLTQLVELTDHAVRRCVTAGIHLVLVSGADPTAGLPFGSVVHRRGLEITDAIRHFGDIDGVTFVDAFNDGELKDRRYWSADRLHLNAHGHQRVAGLILSALGHARPATDPPPPAAATGRIAEARYWREHVAPWVWRRLRGRSSGDGREPKHPDWTAVPVE